MLTAQAFSQIPVSLLTPGAFIEIDNSRALKGLPIQRQRVLLVGQRLAAGTLAAGVVQLLSNEDQAKDWFGRASMLAAMAVAYKAVDNYTETYALGVDDNGAGAAATGTLTFTGPSTAAGTVELYIAGKRVDIGVASGQTANQVAAAAEAAINADLDLPVTAAVLNAVVTLTANHKGELGNAIDVRHSYYPGEALPAGVTLAIVAMAGGTSDPAAAAIVAAISDERYDTIVWPWTSAASLLEIKNEMERRWGALVMKEGHVHSAARGSVATLQTLGNLHNSAHLSIADAGNEPTAPWIKASQIAARDAFEPDPARPRQYLSLPNVLPAARELRRTRSERDTLLAAGIATTIVGDDGTVAIERLVTTYKTNAAGAEDPSYRDVETLRTLAYLRFSLRTRILQRFPRHKLAGDDHPGGPTIARPKDIVAEVIALFTQWEVAGLAEDIDQFKADLQVVRDEDDANRVNALIPPNLVNQFRTFAGLLQFRL